MASKLIGVTPEESRVPIARLRRDRPEADFTISLRTGWDPLGMEPDRITREYDEYEAAGVQHVVSAPWRTNIDDWLRAMDELARLDGHAPTLNLPAVQADMWSLCAGSRFLL